MATKQVIAPEGTDFKDFKAELLKDPEVRREYDALKPKYDLIRELIERRNQLHMSQTQLAKMIGTKQPAISRLENGDHDINISTLLKALAALGLNISLVPVSEPERTRRKVRA